MDKIVADTKPQPEAQADPVFYKLTLIGAPVGTSYSLYLKESARRYSQGIINGKLVIKIPEEWTGPGYITFTTPRVDRLVFSATTSLNFDLDQDMELDVAKVIASQSTTSPASLRSNDQDSQENKTQSTHSKTLIATQKGSKKLVTNRLRDQVQDAKKQSGNANSQLSELSKIDTSDASKSKSFWDKFK